MAPKTGQDIFGFFEPRYVDDASSIEKTPARLPRVIREDEAPLLELPPIDANTQIRLITLLPAEDPSEGGKSMDPVQCTLQTCSLASAPEYEALSYTWGQMHRHLPISVLGTDNDSDGIKMSLLATPQLQMALRRLRRARPRRLWIDQLCINQEDKEECGAQVQLMGDIYKAATRVVIWIGEDHEDMIITDDYKFEREAQRQLLADLFQAFTEKSEHDDDDDDDDATIAARLVDLRFTYHVQDIKKRRMRAVRDFLNRPYFRRAWVFQESSLAKGLVVQFGQQEFDFATLKRVFDSINSAAIRAAMHRDTYSSLAISTGGYEMMDIIQQTREEQRYLGNTIPPDQSSLLLKLLTVVRRVNCYQKQDLIFAFLAFQRSEGIEATGGMYGKSVEEVWTYTAKRIIQSSGSLDIFAASYGGSPVSGFAIPTWVPCWTNCFPFSRPIATPLSKFRASRGLPHVWIENDDPTKLTVKGKIINTVEQIHGHFGHFMRWKHSVSHFLAFDWTVQKVQTSMVFSRFDRLFGDYRPIKAGLIVPDLMTTFLADGALGAEQPLRTTDKYLDAVRAQEKPRDLRKCGRTLSTDEQHLVECYDMLEDLVLVAEHKCIFTTDYFQIGMAADVTMLGDLVVILHGSQVPCILRKVGESGNEYKLISQCYLHGWMYGNSPREIFGKDPRQYPGVKVRWWEEDPDEFILV
ncbi:hypothetical protein FOMG_07536 [Fusarium oxysporum f. sp. melonis 26406]|uniref:Heterokaryon incompatibility domain-containing protein n=1 Tax=Fusarium oxysporum f. sp. melonis 26406 TaxID=1089452 RepID=X0AAU6_FUSOX|nr:hypothetical protein FOMG_07536 [Fusarium oxysporum f. sp. melonis 26406]